MSCKYKNVNKYILFIIIICLNGKICNSQERKRDSILSITGEYQHHKNRKKTPPFEEILKFISDSLNLDDITKGFDSLEIRIWLSNMRRGFKQQVFIFKKPTKEDQIIVYDFEPHFLEERYDSVTYFSKQRVEIIPRNGVDSFFNYMIKRGILNLPDESSSENYSTFYDTENITIEVASLNFYRLINYRSPYRLWKIGHNKNGKKLVELLSFLKKQLNVKYIQGFNYPEK